MAFIAEKTGLTASRLRCFRGAHGVMSRDLKKFGIYTLPASRRSRW
jgi:hypothetical protein